MSSGPPSACEGPKTSTRSGPKSGIQHSLCPGECGVSASRGMQWASRSQGWRDQETRWSKHLVTEATGLRQKVADEHHLRPIERDARAAERSPGEKRDHALDQG